MPFARPHNTPRLPFHVCCPTDDIDPEVVADLAMDLRDPKYRAENPPIGGWTYLATQGRAELARHSPKLQDLVRRLAAREQKRRMNS